MADLFNKWKNDLVPVQAPMGIVLFIVNIFLPGIGTIINSFMSSSLRSDTLLVGLLQLLTAIIIVGWIWSIYWGYLMYQQEKK